MHDPQDAGRIRTAVYESPLRDISPNRKRPLGLLTALQEEQQRAQEKAAAEQAGQP
jgi:hypothetical protein